MTSIQHSIQRMKNQIEQTNCFRLIDSIRPNRVTSNQFTCASRVRLATYLGSRYDRKLSFHFFRLVYTATMMSHKSPSPTPLIKKEIPASHISLSGGIDRSSYVAREYSLEKKPFIAVRFERLQFRRRIRRPPSPSGQRRSKPGTTIEGCPSSCHGPPRCICCSMCPLSAGP